MEAVFWSLAGREHVATNSQNCRLSMRAATIESDRKSRVEQTRLHANAVRQLMRFMRPEAVGASPVSERGQSR
jgi:F-type H+-transporting ATPase subunit epsilon